MFTLPGIVLSASKTPPQAWLAWITALSAACESKDRQLSSHTGHMPGLQAMSPAGGVREATNRCISCTSMFLSLSFSLFSPPSKNKYIKILKNKTKTKMPPQKLVSLSWFYRSSKSSMEIWWLAKYSPVSMWKVEREEHGFLSFQICALILLIHFFLRDWGSWCHRGTVSWRTWLRLSSFTCKLCHPG